MSSLLTVDRERLLAWAEANRRDLPWRRTRDPWAVLVSELMLQQTQVSRVVPRYESFLETFPSPARCASAPVAEVIRLWAGLGYNRRAVNLHRASIEIVDRHGGTVPADLGALLELSGVGPYTARAVLAFAFEHDVAVVDTNVARICARLAGRKLNRREVQACADALSPVGRSWAWNQGLLDLGATLCTSRQASCGDCPLRADCAWSADACRQPDPARGSAGVSAGQSRFEGSDRQGRGRLVDELRRTGRVPAGDLATIVGWADAERAERVAHSLVIDGLATWDGNGALTMV